tara:strand:+ start:10778 stop:11194 length:417 start_codon:yes stop_codon:yes gene_type:complete
MMEALACIALAVYFEARGEPIAGQLAVANVVMNRARSSKYPDTPCEVVTQGPTYVGSTHPVKHRCQFSFYCDGKPEKITDHDAWLTAMRVATAVRDTSSQHLDVSEGATHYHTTEVSPRWRYTMRVTVQIGQHIFYKP